MGIGSKKARMSTGSGQEGDDGQDEREHSEEPAVGNGGLVYSPDQMHQAQLPRESYPPHFLNLKKDSHFHLRSTHGDESLAVAGHARRPRALALGPNLRRTPALLAHQHSHAHAHHSHSMSMNDVLRQQQAMGPAMTQQQQYATGTFV